MEALPRHADIEEIRTAHAGRPVRRHHHPTLSPDLGKTYDESSRRSVAHERRSRRGRREDVDACSRSATRKIPHIVIRFRCRSRPRGITASRPLGPSDQSTLIFTANQGLLRRRPAPPPVTFVAVDGPHKRDDRHQELSDSAFFSRDRVGVGRLIPISPRHRLRLAGAHVATGPSRSSPDGRIAYAVGHSYSSQDWGPPARRGCLREAAQGRRQAGSQVSSDSRLARGKRARQSALGAYDVDRDRPSVIARQSRSPRDRSAHHGAALKGGDRPGLGHG